MRTLPLVACLLLFTSQAGRAQGDLSVTGAPVRLIEETTRPFAHPLWSPDGARLAFTSPNYQGLWVVERGGQTIQPVTDEPAAGFGFAWSPDGGALLARVARFEGPRRYNAVKVFNLETGRTLQLTDYRTRMPALPQWSPSGARVFLYTEGYLETFDAGNTANTAGKMDTENPVTFASNDRIGRASLASGAVSVVEAFEDRAVLNLVRSPDGDRLAFELLGGHLHVMNADGSGLLDLGPGSRPRWSPDGQWLAFMRTEDDGTRFTAADLYAVRADGGPPVKLTDTPDRLEMNPSWSPDGQSIVFDEAREGVLYRLPLAR